MENYRRGINLQSVFGDDSYLKFWFGWNKNEI